MPVFADVVVEAAAGRRCGGADASICRCDRCRGARTLDRFAMNAVARSPAKQSLIDGLSAMTALKRSLPRWRTTA